LLKARHVTFGVTVLTLLLLLAFGKRVSYEQSIKSFFAEDDPNMVAYQEAARAFGDDNFVFVAYDDPDLLTPAGMDRVAELVKQTRDETFVETLPDGKLVNHSLGIFSLGGATMDNEWNYTHSKLMRAIGVVAIENQARI